MLRDAAGALSEREGIPMSLALAKVHVQLCRQAAAYVTMPTHFVCDAGLGGLARWLRAAGYDAVWQTELDDAGVIREAQRRGATLLTTDTLMMERGVLRDGIVPGVHDTRPWMPDFRGALTDAELADLLAYLRSLTDRPPWRDVDAEVRRASKGAG